MIGLIVVAATPEWRALHFANYTNASNAARMVIRKSLWVTSVSG